MKHVWFCLVVLSVMASSGASWALSTLEIMDDGSNDMIVCRSIKLNYYVDVVSGSNDDYLRYGRNERWRSIIEIDLSPVYEQNILLASIVKIEFYAALYGVAPGDGSGATEHMDILAMTENEDGEISQLTDHYFNATESIGLEYVFPSGDLEVDITDAVLPDLQSGQDWSGIIIKAHTEGDEPGAAYFARQLSNPLSAEPRLIIYYDETMTADAVPEPWSILLLGIACTAYAAKRRSSI